MRATYLYGAGDAHPTDTSDPTILVVPVGRADRAPVRRLRLTPAVSGERP